ncbi:MAG: tRNA (guanosine(37)-N1)-methyltransferase TrmD [Clostridia bacterium]|nr:tRNA (guanosine(37)-N1)-methyltransferase TrmD [Clostridia bacterium]
MNIDILTLFPEMFDSVLGSSMLGKAQDRGIFNVRTLNIRDYTLDKHKKTDDTPYGGGAGMVMSAQPVFDALRAVNAESKRIIYMSPRGRQLDGELAKELALEENLVFLCGHYEGVDQRILDYWKPEEITIGDYILTGGELAAMVVIDAMARFIPDVLGNDESVLEESIYSGLIEYPQYTKPREYEGMGVPEVLTSGDHKKIRLWNFEQACMLTKERRPDLWREFLKGAQELEKAERKIIDKIENSRR